MMNSKIIDNGIGNSVNGVPLFHNQPPIATKKAVLRDVQNDTRNLIHNCEETAPFVGGKFVANASKLSGTKRLTPEYPSSHFPNNGVNKHFTYTRKKTETEPTKASGPQLGYFCQKQNQMKLGESNVNFCPVVTTNHMSSFTSYGPTLLGKPGNGLFAVEHDSLMVTTEVPRSVNNQPRKEQFGSPQNYLKNYNEFDKRDYTQMLLHLAPAELSRHAVDLEKRAIQLTMEEGKEIQRMKQLNILGKTATTGNYRETSQQLQSKK